MIVLLARSPVGIGIMGTAHGPHCILAATFTPISTMGSTLCPTYVYYFHQVLKVTGVPGLNFISFLLISSVVLDEKLI